MFFRFCFYGNFQRDLMIHREINVESVFCIA